VDVIEVSNNVFLSPYYAGEVEWCILDKFYVVKATYAVLVNCVISGDDPMTRVAFA